MKIVFRSIIAIIILIGVSFTSVVGYRSVESDVNISPLFTIRSSRAIDEESGELSCEYVGKGDGINIHLPLKNNNGESIDRYLNTIRTIDDESFDKFLNLIPVYLNAKDDFKFYDKEDIIRTITQLRNNQIDITSLIQKKEGSNLHTYECTVTWEGCPITSGEGGMIWCIFFLFLLIFAVIESIIDIIFVGIPWLLTLRGCS